MRGDSVYRVYGLHEGRTKDQCLGTFRSRTEAEAEIVKLHSREMHGRNWAARYHNRGFIVRETIVDTDFEIPSQPKPRDKYAVQCSSKPNQPGTWDSTVVDVSRRINAGNELEKLCGYERNYSMLQTFEPFRQGNREFALISRDYTKTEVLDLESGNVIAGEIDDPAGGAFCPVGFYVPDWWDVHDGSVIPGSQYWDADYEWPNGDFGFVWGCHWGDDTSWKVQYLDLSKIGEGLIQRDDRFGYLELATSGYRNPCLSPDSEAVRGSVPPHFIDVEKQDGTVRVNFAVEMTFDLESGRPREWRRLKIDEFE